MVEEPTSRIFETLSRQLTIVAATGMAIGISLVAFLTDYERVGWNPFDWWLQAAILSLPCIANCILGVFVSRNRLRRETLLLLPLVYILPVIVFGTFPKWQVLQVPAIFTWFSGALSSHAVSAYNRHAVVHRSDEWKGA